MVWIMFVSKNGPHKRWLTGVRSRLECSVSYQCSAAPQCHKDASLLSSFPSSILSIASQHLSLMVSGWLSHFQTPMFTLRQKMIRKDHEAEGGMLSLYLLKQFPKHLTQPVHMVTFRCKKIQRGEYYQLGILLFFLSEKKGRLDVVQVTGICCRTTVGLENRKICH